MRLCELLVAFSGVQCWISLFLVSLFLPEVVKTVPVPCEHGTTGTRVSERSDTLFQFVLVTVQLLPIPFENCSVLLYRIDPSQLTSWQSGETSACLVWTQVPCEHIVTSYLTWTQCIISLSFMNAWSFLPVTYEHTAAHPCYKINRHTTLHYKTSLFFIHLFLHISTMNGHLTSYTNQPNIYRI